MKVSLLLSLLVSAGVMAMPEMIHSEITSLRELTALPSIIETPRDISIPLDPEFNKQWWHHNSGQVSSDNIIGVAGADTSMLRALEVYSPKKEIVIAVIDSGLDLNHEDFDSSILWVNELEQNGIAGVDDDNNGYIDDIHGHNIVMKNNNFTDSKAHGTHVTGLISAISNNDKGIFGAVEGVKIMLIKLWDIGGDIFTTPTAEAIRYACDNGANILSNSYGTPSPNAETKAAIKYCLKKGALFVGASGNLGRNLNIEPDYPSSFGIANQIVVGASTNYDGRALFSNYGKVVELFAPGEDIYSLKPKNRYKESSGTSQACPLVSLAAAMTWSHNPELSVLELKGQIIKGGDQKISLTHWSSNGQRLNIYNAILGLEGDRLPNFDLSKFQSEELVIESAHPYPKKKDFTKIFEMKGIKRFRLHFKKFDIYNYDRLTLEVKEGEIVDIITSNLGEFWTEVIEGDYLKLTLKSKSGPIKYGYTIDRVEFQR
ncbi:MAG: S8 family serine peptidase [Bacteriovoracaceae bacterium]|nr:S8 family serine peptidase [Bacteriovoracaceae bacterium]